MQLTEHIIHTTAKRFRVTPEQIQSPSRRMQLTDARHIAMFLCRENTNLTDKAIGAIFNRHYSSVIYGVQRIVQEQKRDERLTRILEILRKEIREGFKEGIQL